MKESEETMAMPNDQGEQSGTYFIEAENAAEMARLLKQDLSFTRDLGGPLPERSDLTGIHDVLDIACGPGAWAMELARSQPDIQVTGGDISRLMIEYARTQAQQQGLHNARFQLMDALQPLAFADKSFDLVNIRLIFGFMPTEAWPKLIQECVRITRPGGVIRLSELEMGITNGPRSEQMSSLFTQALKRAGKSFSPDGRHIGIVSMLGKFLRTAGCLHVRNQAYALDYSTGSEGYAAGYENIMVLFKLIQPLLVRTGVTTQQEVNILYQQVMEEMQGDDFCAVIFYITTWGEIPEHAV